MTLQITQIIGRRWFQRTYGNTYHTAEVFYSDGTSKKSGVTYGYGSAWKQTASELAEKGGIQWMADLHHYAVDVARKKDL